MKSGKNLQKAARKKAEKLPGSEWGRPFGPDSEVYKINRKIFLMLTRIPADTEAEGISDRLRGKRVLVVKAEPEDAKALRSEYPEIGPGYHMNKEHWISVANGENIRKKLVKELVADSYRAVKEQV